jgi:hypothetical protein
VCGESALRRDSRGDLGVSHENVVGCLGTARVAGAGRTAESRRDALVGQDVCATDDGAPRGFDAHGQWRSAGPVEKAATPVYAYQAVGHLRRAVSEECTDSAATRGASSGRLAERVRRAMPRNGSVCRARSVRIVSGASRVREAHRASVGKADLPAHRSSPAPVRCVSSGGAHREIRRSGRSHSEVDTRLWTAASKVDLPSSATVRLA